MPLEAELTAPLIHLGYQKAASTFLQRHVFSDAEAFVCPWGVQAVEAIEALVLAHPERFDPQFVSKTTTGTDRRVPVVSHEDLLGYPVHGRYYAEQVLTRLAQAIPAARLLVCIRNQPDMLVSNYFQYVRQGGTKTLRAVLCENRDRPGFRPHFRLDHFEYDLMYDLVTRHFPPEQVLFLPLEMLKAEPNRFVGAIGAFVGKRVSAPDQTGAANVRHSVSALGLQRRLNNIIARPADMRGSFEARPLAQRFKVRAVMLTNRLTRGGRGDRRGMAKLRGEIREILGSHFAGSNARTSARIGLDLGPFGYDLG
jgi:hypothetical protein